MQRNSQALRKINVCTLRASPLVQAKPLDCEPDGDEPAISEAADVQRKDLTRRSDSKWRRSQVDDPSEQLFEFGPSFDTHQRV